MIIFKEFFLCQKKILHLSPDKLSIAFRTSGGIGDFVITKKVFDAIVEMVPNCKIDIFCDSEINETYIKAVYTGNKNLNRSFTPKFFVEENIVKFMQLNIFPCSIFICRK